MWQEKWQWFYCTFLAKSNGEWIFKFGQHLAKLWTKNIVGLFLTHSVDYITLQYIDIYVVNVYVLQGNVVTLSRRGRKFCRHRVNLVNHVTANFVTEFCKTFGVSSAGPRRWQQGYRSTSRFDSGLYHSRQQLWAGCVHLLAQWGVMLWQVSSWDKHCVAVLGRLFTHRSGFPGQLSLLSLRDRYMSTSFGWEGNGRYGSFRPRINVWVCRWNCQIPWQCVIPDSFRSRLPAIRRYANVLTFTFTVY